MRVQLLPSVHAVAPAAWDDLWSNRYPFVRHAFLAALEDTGCTTATSGWEPTHLVIEQEGQLVAAMPAYRKHHSFGEYVFDWSWADAFQRYGYEYYPKLVNAIPFTPATGPRWCWAQGQAPSDLLQAIFSELDQQMTEGQFSSFHCLFPEAQQSAQLAPFCSQRLGCQFHWFNNNFQDFEDFLATFNSRKRKSLKRERKRVAEQAIEIQTLMGDRLSEADWDAFYDLYRLTYLKRSGHEGYLNREFFMRMGAQLWDQVAMVKALHGDQWVAAALYFFDDHTLYGRYWGTQVEFDGLHFECCYYRGIELAIALGLQRFDPGAQGEHKIQRGFTPVLTQSAHRLVASPFAEPIAHFVQSEQEQIRQYCASARELLPFKEGTQLPAPECLIRPDTTSPATR